MPIRSRLLRRAANIDRPQNRSVLVVKNRNIRRRVAQHIEPVIVGIVQIPIRISLDIDLLQNRERLPIKHRHRLRCRKSVSRRGVHRSTVRAGARNIAYLRQRIQVEYANVPLRSTPRHVQVAPVGIGCHVIESAIAAHQLNLRHLVWTILRRSHSRAPNPNSCCNHRQCHCFQNHIVRSISRGFHPKQPGSCAPFIAGFIAMSGSSLGPAQPSLAIEHTPCPLIAIPRIP